MAIEEIHARWILDSRAKPTVEVELSDGKNKVKAASPSGASTGKKEAKELRDNGKTFHGYGVSKAVANVRNILAPLLKGKNPEEQEEIDKLMIKADGTVNKERIGANAMIATSIAVAKLGAAAKEVEVYKHIEEITKSKAKLPKTMFNIINGGEHAGNELAVQEFLIVPQQKEFSERYECASEVYLYLKDEIKRRYGRDAINVGDEGGFAPPLKETREALELIEKAIGDAGCSGEVKISMDAAANSFYSDGSYRIDGKKLTSDELVDYWTEVNSDYKLLSLEDPFSEDDFEGFKALKSKNCCKIIGDDLTVTNVERLKKFAEGLDGLIIKPNQIGTLTETFETVSFAREKTPFIIVSHRSGETEDAFIAEMAAGLGSPYAKFGAPARGERTCKYNQLLRIEEKL